MKFTMPFLALNDLLERNFIDARKATITLPYDDFYRLQAALISDKEFGNTIDKSVIGNNEIIVAGIKIKPN